MPLQQRTGRHANIDFGFQLNVTNEWVMGKNADKVVPPLIANRDIKAGEEFLCHYGSFVKNGRPGRTKLGMTCLETPPS